VPGPAIVTRNRGSNTPDSDEVSVTVNRALSPDATVASRKFRGGEAGARPVLPDLLVGCSTGAVNADAPCGRSLFASEVRTTYLSCCGSAIGASPDEPELTCVRRPDGPRHRAGAEANTTRECHEEPGVPDTSGHEGIYGGDAGQPASIG
jgi:hypothetical protein